MNFSNNDKVNDFLADIQLVSAEQFDTVLSIREMFVNASQNVEEDIKYGGIVFFVSGVLVGGIYTYKAHISIEFSDGAGFTDEDSILEGGGKKRRHLKIHSAEDIAQKNSDYFIKQAVSKQ